MANFDNIFSLIIIKGGESPAIMPLPSLPSQIQALPSKVRDYISSHVLATPSRNAVVITRGYKPPSNIQLSSATRAEAADAYYANTSFHLPSYLCVPFLAGLTSHHRSLIRHICLDGQPKPKPLAGDVIEQKAIMAGHKLRWRNVCEVKQRLRDAEIEGVGDGVIRMWVWFRGQKKATRKVVWTADFDATREEMGMPADGLEGDEVRWMSVKGEVWTQKAKGSIGRVLDKA